MAIVVRRDTGGFAVVRRLRVRLDGVTVGRIGPGRSLELTGSGGPQQLSVSIDWVRSNRLTVIDPGPGSVLDVELSHRGVADSRLRTWLAPESVLVLVPAGQSVPLLGTGDGPAEVVLVVPRCGPALVRRLIPQVQPAGNDSCSLTGSLVGTC